MKLLRAFYQHIPRKFFAVMFACLFMLQGMGLVQALLVNKPSLHASTVAGDQNAEVRDKNHCIKLNDGQGLPQGHCSHIGFCALCSVDGRGLALTDQPPSTRLIAIISLQTVSLAPIVAEFDPALLHSSIGIEHTYSILAPPRA
jgi:hypothetical protein